MLTKYGLRIGSKLCTGRSQFKSIMPYKAHLIYDGFRMFRSTSVLMKNSGDKQPQAKRKSKQNSFEQFKDSCYQQFTEEFKTVPDHRLEEVIKAAFKKYQSASRGVRHDKSDEAVDDKTRIAKVEESLKRTLADPAELYKNYLSNPSGEVIDASSRVSAQDEEDVRRMTTAELFGLNDAFAGLSAEEKNAVDVFVAEFNSLKKLRIDKEFEEAKKTSTDKKQPQKQSVSALMNELKEQVDKTSGMISKNYPYSHQEHKWILEGMADYYFDSQRTIAQIFSDKAQEKHKGDEVIKEFVSSMKGENRHLIKQKAYRTIGQLFVEFENKHFGKRTESVQESQEPTKEELRDSLKNLLIKKLKELRPKRSKLETSGRPLLDKDEFIGQDEYIVDAATETVDEYPEIITQIDYKAQEFESKPIPDISEVYSVQRGKDHAKTATFFRKELDGKLDKIKEVAIHNEAMVEEYKKGQEGVEYVHVNPEADPRYITERKLRKMFKSQLDSMKYDEKKFKDPNSRAAEFERNRNRILNIKINKDEVKNYPGSAKGRKPEDDKDFYATWFMSNRPESLKAVEEEVIIPIIEANRRKVPKSRRDQKGEERTHESNEFYYFKHFDKEFRLADQENIPVWEIVEDKDHDTFYWSSMHVVQENNPDEKYAYDEWDRKIELVDSSQLGLKEPYDTSKLHEIPIFPYQMPLEFNEAMMHAHHWAQFRITPQVIYEVSQFRKALKEYARNQKEPETPSLWAYYETLPEWCRENHFIRGVLMALEYSKPLLPIRTKEMALNYACSFLVPVDQKTEEILDEMFNSKRPRLNHEKARQMMQELPKYEVDFDQLGTEYMNVLEEKTAPGKVFDKDDRLNVFDKMDQKSSSFEDDWKEVNKSSEIDRFELEKDTGQNALKDFVCKPYPKSTDTIEDPSYTYPLRYFDNDDHFWDDFIEEKHVQYDKMSMILKRPYLKH